MIVSLLTQIGWKAKIQSIITESDLSLWYEKALRGPHSQKLAKKVIDQLIDQISNEFPSSDNHELLKMKRERGYLVVRDSDWS
jgi:type II restriction enzyme